MNPWIVSLSEGAIAREDAGEKAWRLSLLSSEGLPVPDGFVVTRSAYQALASASTERSAEQVAQLDRHLALAFDDHFEPETLVAVRSSAIGEDGETASFAGQYKTLYFVDRAGVADAVVAVWRSIADSQAYRDNLGAEQRSPAETCNGSDEAPEMAVIVQRMVDARSSGVCFGADPVGDYPGSIVESIWGLGAALVDGRVSPDRFSVSRRFQIDRRHVARKPLQVVRDGSASDRLDSVDSSRQQQPSISDDEAIAVARLTAHCSELAGAPQDVEWCIDSAGELKLLQSRPITGKQVSATPIEGEWVAFKPILENFTEPLTPLTIDLVAQVLPGFGRFVDGRFYLNARTLKAMLPFKLSEPEWVDLLLLRRRDPPPISWPKAIAVGVACLLSYPVWGSLARRSTHVPGAVFDAYSALCDRVMHDGRMTPPRALRRLFLGGSPLAPIGLRAFQANMSAGRYFLLVGLLRSLLARWAPDINESDLTSLTSASDDIASTNLIEELRELARLASASTDVRSALDNIADGKRYAEVARELSGTPFASAFTSALADFLQRYGHRGTSEVEIMSPRWREEPAAVLALVRNLIPAGANQQAANPAQPTTLAEDRYRSTLVTRDRLHQALKQRWKRTTIDTLLRSIKDFVRLRENTRNAHVRTFDVLRRRVLLIEQQLLARGALKCPDDIFFLRWEEIEHLLDARWQWTDAMPVIAERRNAHVAASARGPRLTINMAASTSRPEDPARLFGQCACPGVVDGYARVVMRPGSDTVLTGDDILVAPYTDPSWTPLFPAAAAIVVDVGSYLSHAGTVAREFGTPCIVDVSGATRRLRDGERLRVDATNGEVTRLDLLDGDKGGSL